MVHEYIEVFFFFLSGTYWLFYKWREVYVNMQEFYSRSNNIFLQVSLAS